MRKPILIAAFIILAAGMAAGQHNLKPGSACLAYWAENELYYIGTVVEAVDSGYRVIFADGDQAVVSAGMIKPYAYVKVGAKVLALWEDGKSYPGIIARVVGGAFYIRFDDGDEGWTSAAGIAVKFD